MRGFIATISLFIILFACSNDSSNNVNDPQEFGNVEGTVYISGTNNAISGVLVKCSDITSTTNNDGKFTLNNVPAGQQNLTASKSDFEPFSVTVNVIANSTVNKDIYMTSSLATTSLHGFVNHINDNNPIQGAKITVGNISDYTDATGHYQIPNVPQGEQNIIVEHNDYDTFSGIVYLYSSDKEYNILMTWKYPIILEANGLREYRWNNTYQRSEYRVTVSAVRVTDELGDNTIQSVTAYVPANLYPNDWWWRLNLTYNSSDGTWSAPTSNWRFDNHPNDFLILAIDNDGNEAESTFNFQ